MIQNKDNTSQLTVLFKIANWLTNKLSPTKFSTLRKSFFYALKMFMTTMKIGWVFFNLQIWMSQFAFNSAKAITNKEIIIQSYTYFITQPWLKIDKKTTTATATWKSLNWSSNKQSTFTTTWNNPILFCGERESGRWIFHIFWSKHPGCLRRGSLKFLKFLYQYRYKTIAILSTV